MFYKRLLLTYNDYNKMVQIDCDKYSKKLIIINHITDYNMCVFVKRWQRNQQTNFVGGPDKNINVSLLLRLEYQK